jgi:hypothetical protein
MGLVRMGLTTDHPSDCHATIRQPVPAFNVLTREPRGNSEDPVLGENGFVAFFSYSRAHSYNEVCEGGCEAWGFQHRFERCPIHETDRVL